MSWQEEYFNYLCEELSNGASSFCFGHFHKENFHVGGKVRNIHLTWLHFWNLQKTTVVTRFQRSLSICHIKKHWMSKLEWNAHLAKCIKWSKISKIPKLFEIQTWFFQIWSWSPTVYCLPIHTHNIYNKNNKNSQLLISKHTCFLGQLANLFQTPGTIVSSRPNYGVYWKYVEQTLVTASRRKNIIWHDQ